jgi:hypothetical protein
MRPGLRHLSPTAELPRPVVRHTHEFRTHWRNELNVTLDVAQFTTESVRFELLTPADHGSATLLADGRFAYAAEAYRGYDHFTVRARQGSRYSVPVSVMVDVTNTAPQQILPAPYEMTVTAGAQVGGLISMMDTDNDPLTFALGELPLKGAVALDAGNGAITYTANASAAGQDAFSVYVSDGVDEVEVQAAVTINSAAPQPPTNPPPAQPQPSTGGGGGGAVSLLECLCAALALLLGNGRRRLQPRRLSA